MDFTRFLDFSDPAMPRIKIDALDSYMKEREDQLDKSVEAAAARLLLALRERCRALLLQYETECIAKWEHVDKERTKEIELLKAGGMDLLQPDWEEELNNEVRKLYVRRQESLARMLEEVWDEV